MRNAGTQLPSRKAAFIPLTGIVFEAIDPANLRGVVSSIAKKETQQKSRAGARVIFETAARTLPRCSTAITPQDL